MPASASAGIGADGSARTPSVSDSDMEIEEEEEVEVEGEEEPEDEDPEEEEEEREEEVESMEEEEEDMGEEEEADEEEEEEEGIEEEGKEEEEEVEEDEEEGVKEDAEDSRNSPNRASDFHEDIERDSVSKRLVKHLGSSSSMTGKFGSCQKLNSGAGVLKLTAPLDEHSTALKEPCLSFQGSQSKKSEKELALTEDKGSQESCTNGNDYECPMESSQPDILNLKNYHKPIPENVEAIGLQNMDMRNTTGEKVSVSVPGSICIGQKFSGACSSGNTQIDAKFEDERSRTTSRPGSFSSSGEVKEPPHKRAALVCEFFAKGWCIRGKSCRFLHVKDNVSSTSRQKAGDNTSGSREFLCDEERTTSDHGVTGKAFRSKENTEASLRGREEISMGITSASHRVFPSKENMGRERLKQSCADGLESRHPVNNDGNSSLYRCSFVQSSVPSYRATDVVSSQIAWTRTVPSSSFHLNAYASAPQRQLENGNQFYAYGSLSMLPGTSSYSHLDSESNASNKSTKFSSNDWEPSEPFQPSFVIPPSLLSSSGTLYDPFLDSVDVQNPGGRSLNASLLSKGEHYKKLSYQCKEGDSAGTQARECSDDKNSSCNQNQLEPAVPEKNSETRGVDPEMAGAEVVATSVVDQNETIPKKGNHLTPAQNKNNLKKSKLDAGHNACRRSDGSSNKKILKAGKAELADDMDGEVRSDAGIVKESKVMRHFRTTLIETIKELLKPTWREGRLSKDVHNMIVKKAAEKVISTAVQFHQVPTDTESVDQYLSVSRPKILKLVEGYVEKYRKC